MSINLKRKKKNNLPEHIINEPIIPVQNTNIQNQPMVQPSNYNPLPMQNFESIQLQRRLRMRHMADGAVNLNVENDDLANDNYGLYDDKAINLERPKVNENISKENTEYYIESIHHDQFFKITQTEKTEEEKKKALEMKSAVGELEGTKKGKKKKKKKKISEEEEEEEVKKKPLTSYELQQITEKKIFDKFDDELTTVINKTISKVSLLFLFTQGLLAGMALINIVLFMMYKDYTTFIRVYAHMAREMFNLFHTLTFASLVGNGIKFITALQKYNLIKRKFNANNMGTFTLLRKNMIFSGILLVLFTVTFGIEIYLTTKIMNINYIKCPEPALVVTEENYTAFLNNLMSEDDFKKFKTMYLAADFIVIVLFILNIFDVNLKEDSGEKVVQANVNVNYYMENSEETSDEI